MKERMKEFYENRKKIIKEGQMANDVGTSDLFGGLRDVLNNLQQDDET